MSDFVARDCDLGGIAKGFAVDRAVKILKCAGRHAGIVNAGGDLRVFGLESELVHFAIPSEPMRRRSDKIRERPWRPPESISLRKNCGVAVSQSRTAAPVDLRASLISVTVGQSDCMMADALTKIVFALRGEAAPLLARNSRGCVVARARRRALLDVSPNVRHVPTRLNPIEALPQTLALRRACAAFF